VVISQLLWEKYLHALDSSSKLKTIPSINAPSSEKIQDMPLISQGDAAGLRFMLMNSKAREVKAPSKLTLHLAIISDCRPCSVPLSTPGAPPQSCHQPKRKRSHSRHPRSPSARESFGRLGGVGESSGPVQKFGVRSKVISAVLTTSHFAAALAVIIRV